MITIDVTQYQGDALVSSLNSVVAWSIATACKPTWSINEVMSTQDENIVDGINHY